VLFLFFFLFLVIAPVVIDGLAKATFLEQGFHSSAGAQGVSTVGRTTAGIVLVVDRLLIREVEVGIIEKGITAHVKSPMARAPKRVLSHHASDGGKRQQNPRTLLAI
tara:strand:+ start:3508 stop:3828 length:321 start_codon:yes stop_codon:yes gene_type:complete